MGVQLSNIVRGNEISIENLFDKRIAVDAYNWIYQFLSIIRQRDGEPLKDSQGRVTSHFSGLFYRTLKLLEAKIYPVYVFDGKPHVFKEAEIEKRRDIRSEAKIEWKKALEKKDYETARKYAQRASTITDEIVADSKKLLKAMGIPVVQAPSEAEALCSVMCKKGDVWAVATQDFDCLLYGTPRFVRNLSITGKKKRGSNYVVVNPELFILNKILEENKINHEQLITLGILVGTDYNPGGVEGIGPKKALELVKKEKTFENVMKNVEWKFDANPKEIFELFMNPESSDYKISFEKPDKEQIQKILCDEHDFSGERIENALKKLEITGNNQKSLSRWFEKHRQ